MDKSDDIDDVSVDFFNKITMQTMVIYGEAVLKKYYVGDNYYTELHIPDSCLGGKKIYRIKSEPIYRGKIDSLNI